MEKISFASDNCAPVDPRIMKALVSANAGHSVSYGGDGYTREAVRIIRSEFGCDLDVYFVYNGTAANVISAKGCLKSFEAVITSDISHISTDETGALENICGSKVLTVRNENGKVTAGSLASYIEYMGDIHKVQPKLVSITQATELGTVYTSDEIRELCGFAHGNGMLVHVDGARMANACAAERTDLKEMIADTGVDILSLGISKNGGMFGDAVVVLDERIKKDFRYVIKHSLNLHSKNRYIAAQFIEFFKDGLFYENAAKANRMMRKLYLLLREIDVKFLTEPRANIMFIFLDGEIYEKLSEKFYFYCIREGLYRIMTSSETTDRDVEGFFDELSRLI